MHRLSRAAHILLAMEMERTFVCLVSTPYIHVHVLISWSCFYTIITNILLSLDSQQPQFLHDKPSRSGPNCTCSRTRCSVWTMNEAAGMRLTTLRCGYLAVASSTKANSSENWTWTRKNNKASTVPPMRTRIMADSFERTSVWRVFLF